MSRDPAVEIVAGALPKIPSSCPDPQCGDSTWDHECELGGERPHYSRAERVVAALIRAGRLLPSDGETRQERGWWIPGTQMVQRHWSFVDDGPYREPDRVRTVTFWPDGSEHRTAWTTPTETAARPGGGTTPEPSHDRQEQP